MPETIRNFYLLKWRFPHVRVQSHLLSPYRPERYDSINSSQPDRVQVIGILNPLYHNTFFYIYIYTFSITALIERQQTAALSFGPIDAQSMTFRLEKGVEENPRGRNDLYYYMYVLYYGMLRFWKHSTEHLKNLLSSNILINKVAFEFPL